MPAVLNLKKIKEGQHQRSARIEKRSIDEDSRTVEVAFSSEEAVPRWFGYEILDHDKKSVDLSRLNNGGAVLVDHDTRQQIGVIEKATIDKDRVGRATIRFGNSERAEQEWRDVKDGIRQHISVGYAINEAVLDKIDEDGPDTYRVTDWMPYEVSFVSVPADPSVGVGRDYKPSSDKPIDINPDKEQKIMEPQVTETRENQPGQPLPQPAVNPPVSQPTPQIDVNTVRAEEIKRTQEILSIGERFNLRDLATAAIGNGASVDEFRAQVLDQQGKPKVVQVPDNAADIGLDEKEVRSYSITRAINALVAQREGKANAFKDAGFELECSRAVAQKVGKDAQGIYMPYDVMRRDLTVGTATAGGHLVANELLSMNFIDLLRHAMVIMGMGVQTLSGLEGNIFIPRQTGGATAYWVTEGGAPTESQQAFDQVSMSPKTVGAFTDMSRKLLKQSSTDIEAFVRRDLAITLAQELQRVAINGDSGSDEPEGILNTTGIGSVVGGTNGAAPTWDHIVDLEGEVDQDNALLGSLGYLTNTKVKTQLKKTLKASAAGASFIWEGKDTPLNGYAAGATNAVPSDLDKGTSTGVCSAIIFGNFADLIMGMWGGLDVLIDPYTQATSGTVRVVTHQDVDLAVRHPQSFAAMLDALTA